MSAKLVNKLMAQNIFTPLPKRFTYIFLFTLLAILKTGIGIFPAIPMFLDIQEHGWTLPTYPPIQQYLAHSPGTGLLAHLIGLHGLRSYVIMCGFLILINLFLLVPLLSKHLNFESFPLLILICLTPVPNVLLQWVGSPDSITVFGILLASFKNSKFAVFFGFTIMAFQHFEISIIIALSLIIITFGNEIRAIWQKVVARELIKLSGIFLGWALAQQWLLHSKIMFGRELWVKEYGISYFIHAFLTNASGIVLSTFGLGWLVIAILFLRSHRRMRISILLTCLIVIGTSVVALDQTRVSSLVALGILYELLSQNDLMEIVTRSWLCSKTFQVVVAIWVPIIFWGGQAYGPGNKLVLDWIATIW